MADTLSGLDGHHCLIVPGWRGSGNDHWQTHWQHRLPSTSRTHVASWHDPALDDWIRALDRAVSGIDIPILLVAHSLGCITVAHWAALTGCSRRIAGALLVAPADVERGSVRRELADFATAWGSQLVVLDNAGHINPASGHHQWEAGFLLLHRLMATGALTTSACPLY